MVGLRQCKKQAKSNRKAERITCIFLKINEFYFLFTTTTSLLNQKGLLFPPNNNNDKTMHHYHLLLFSILFTFAIPSFAMTKALLSHDFWITTLTDKGLIDIALVPVQSDEILHFRIPFNQLTIPINHITKKKIEQGRYISVFNIAVPIRGINSGGVNIVPEGKHIVCQCFKDESGKEPHGLQFTVRPHDRIRGEPIPDYGPIRSIYCSDWPGMQKYLNDRGIYPSPVGLEEDYSKKGNTQPRPWTAPTSDDDLLWS